MLFFFFSPLRRLLPNQFQSARCRCCFMCVVVVAVVAIVIRLPHYSHSEFNHSMNESENRIKTNTQRRRLILSTAQCSASVWQQVVSKKQNQSIYKTILMFIFSSLVFFFFGSLLFICLPSHLVTNRWQRICSPPFEFLFISFVFFLNFFRLVNEKSVRDV